MINSFKVSSMGPRISATILLALLPGIAGAHPFTIDQLDPLAVLIQQPPLGPGLHGRGQLLKHVWRRPIHCRRPTRGGRRHGVPRRTCGVRHCSGAFGDDVVLWGRCDRHQNGQNETRSVPAERLVTAISVRGGFPCSGRSSRWARAARCSTRAAQSMP